ncbi:MAG TPA: prephenate dehydrogenase/arogenate dehydrogenase family protein [Lachnospiraceae bacterium]|nr:prephenate dehydrogenase/arogenate dehydrogenase family protein [Lachnospiraceae bacterium]
MVTGIIGLGLIGGSVARALKSLGHTVLATSRSEKSLSAAKKEGVIDEYSLGDLSLFMDCNIVFICTSVDKIPYYAQKLQKLVSNECILTDVGSTKSGIYEKMLSMGNINFIGGHPMAGSEKTGYFASDVHLLDNAWYILTPLPHVKEEYVRILTDTVAAMGAKPLLMDPYLHDRCVAAVSHLPHIVASTLVNTVKDLSDKDGYMHSIAAGGFKDITRIAGSSPEVWSSICTENKKEIISALDAFIYRLTQIKNNIEKDESTEEFFACAREYRNSFANTLPNSTSERELTVNIADKPGSVAVVSALLSFEDISIKNIGVIPDPDSDGTLLAIAFATVNDKNRALKLLEKHRFIG